MGWLNKLIDQKVEEKLNESQYLIAAAEGTNISTRENEMAYCSFYESIEVVNRGVNMIVDDVAEIRTAVGDPLKIDPVRKGVRKVTLDKLLNSQPNPFQDINSFKRNLIIDFIIDGNIFIYFDGAHLYHLPAANVTITPDPSTYVSHYEYNGLVTYTPSEIIHIKENSFYSIYRGISRLRPAERTMKLLTNMRTFQDNFFKNGAVPGLVLKSPNTLSEKIKTRMLASWQLRYSPTGGGKRPLILDGGMEIDSVAKVNFKELDFEDSISSNEVTILKSLGVPPILLDGGNNANIRPNHRLYYLETVLPIVRKMNFAFEHFFGFKLKEDVADVPALQPELSELASYHSTLVNGGIITANEAREALGKEEVEGHSDIRIPANIAGSAVNPEEGGRPEGSKE